MRKIEDLLGMPVLSTAEGRRLGKVEGVELAPQEGHVCYLCLKPEDHDAGRLIPWSEIDSIGQDVVLVRSAGGLVKTIPASEETGLASHVGDRPVLTAAGEKLGHILSYTFDEKTGQVEQYQVGTPGVLGFGGHLVEIAPADIRTFGHDAIIVDAASAPRGSESAASAPQARDRREHVAR